VAAYPEKWLSFVHQYFWIVYRHPVHHTDRGFIWSELQVNKTLRQAKAQYLLTSIWKDPTRET
jgi:hypothetical protein